MRLFETSTECGAIVETSEDGTIVIIGLPIALGPDEAEELGVMLMRAAQWQRMADANLLTPERP